MYNTKRKNDENDEISIKNKKSKVVTQDQQNDSGVSVILELPGVSREKKISYNVQDEEILQGDWTELPLSKYVTTHLKERVGFKSPSQIQRESIPAFLKGTDLVIKAATGSGKTLCYVVPIIEKLSSIEPRITRGEGTYAIILVPTRELALQTYQTLVKISQCSIWIVPGILTGGEKKKAEKNRIRKGITILVSTPGRLLDHLNTTESFNLENLHYIVLDEADRLMDMGFQQDVNNILDICKNRVTQITHPLQHILLSATLDSRINSLISLKFNNPLKIAVQDITPINSINNNNNNNNDDEMGKIHKEGEEINMNSRDMLNDAKVPVTLHQHYIIVNEKQRLVTLSAFLRWKTKAIESCKIIVFLATCDAVEFHSALLSQTTITDEKTEKEEQLITTPIYRLHGNLPQHDRTQIYLQFKQSKSGILFCTDVVARGMDFPSIDWIVQYDPPPEPKEYVHRVGRTARIGREGNALLFLLPSEEEYLNLLHNYKLQKLPVEKVVPKIGDSILLQLCFENMVYNNKQLNALATAAYTSCVRAYSTHCKETKHIFHVKRLHLGHVAKSFGLKEPPSQFLSFDKKKKKMEKRKENKGREPIKKNKMKTYSEFDSGI